MNRDQGQDPAITVGSLDGRPSLALGDAVQSVLVGLDGDEPAGYWRWLLPDTAPARVLLLGLGGATVVRLLLRRFPQAHLTVTGVDDDTAMLARAAEAFGLDLPGLQIEQADAAVYLQHAIRQGLRFDFVCVDLFRNGEIPPLVCRARFLRHLASALAPAGLLTINLNRGRRRSLQLRRLRRRFALERLIGAGMNLVVHARPRPRRRYQQRPRTVRR